MSVVIAAVDGSAPAAEASVWAARLACRSGAELVVASAWAPGQAEGTAADFAHRREAAAALLERHWSEPARRAGADPRPVLVDGAPLALLDLAAEEAADLLVVGSRGDSGPGQQHLGGVSHQLAHHATRPLAIVPGSAADRDITTIALGVDGSAGSGAAVTWCATWAPLLDARVVAVLADEPFLEWVTDDDPRSWRRTAERHVDSWVAALRGADVQVDTVIVRDIHPVAAIAQTALHRDADLIVVGARPRPAVLTTRHRGVAVDAVHRAQLPVVLVPSSEL